MKFYSVPIVPKDSVHSRSPQLTARLDLEKRMLHTVDDRRRLYFTAYHIKKALPSTFLGAFGVTLAVLALYFTVFFLLSRFNLVSRESTLWPHGTFRSLIIAGIFPDSISGVLMNPVRFWQKIPVLFINPAMVYFLSYLFSFYFVVTARGRRIAMNLVVLKDRVSAKSPELLKDNRFASEIADPDQVKELDWEGKYKFVDESEWDSFEKTVRSLD